MKRHQVDPGNFCLLKPLAETAHAIGTSILDPKAKDHLVETLKKSIDEHQNHLARIHGFHVQSMFAHTSSALGQCEIIREEGSGEFFDESGQFSRADFRIMTRANGQMLVEVKDHYKETARFHIKGTYVELLRECPS